MIGGGLLPPQNSQFKRRMDFFMRPVPEGNNSDMVERTGELLHPNTKDSWSAMKYWVFCEWKLLISPSMDACEARNVHKAMYENAFWVLKLGKLAAMSCETAPLKPLQ
jgi:hypothetical protein